MHFIIRLILKGLFPLKATDTLTDAQITTVRSKYGFMTVLMVIGVGILIFSIAEGLLSTIFGLFYPGEKDGCFICYDNSAITEILVAIPVSYFLMREFLRRRFKEDYEAVKIYWSMKNGYSVPRAVKAFVLLVFLLGGWFNFSSTGSNVRFCADGFEARNFSTNEKGEKVKGPVSYKYKDIFRAEYCYSITTNKDHSTYESFSAINLQLNNGDQVELQNHNFGEGSNNVKSKVIERVMKSTGFTKMDTVLLGVR